jgi:hypothetical protein
MSSAPAPQRALVPPPPLVALAGWLVPGLGYWLIGQRARGTTIGLTVVSMFLFGMLVGGVRTVDAALIESVDQKTERLADEAAHARETRGAGSQSEPGAAEKQSAYRPPNVLVRTLQKPWFIGQVMAGPIAIVTAYAGATWGGNAGAPYSHARVYEIGVLYTAVAGMLNLMAVIDSAYRASNEGGR